MRHFLPPSLLEGLGEGEDLRLLLTYEKPTPPQSPPARGGGSDHQKSGNIRSGVANIVGLRIYLGWGCPGGVINGNFAEKKRPLRAYLTVKHSLYTIWHVVPSLDILQQTTTMQSLEPRQ